MIERVYQKEENLVRKEWKVSAPMSVNKFEEAIKKGVAEHDRVQASFELKEEVRRVSEAVKFTNSRLCSIEKLNAAMFNSLCKLLDLESPRESQNSVEGQRRLGEYVS